MNDNRYSASAAILRRWWIVLGGAIVAAAITYGISKAVPATYASTADVSVLVRGTDVNATTLGANNLASQYAQMVDATQVLSDASRQLKSDIPSSAVAGGTVGAQNIVSIRATARTAALAQARAAAMTTAFVGYISNQETTQTLQYQQTAAAQLKPLNAQITAAEAKLPTAGASVVSPRTLSLEQTLSTLVAQRAAALSNIAQTALAGRPSVRVVSTAGAGSQVAPKPSLYALIAFILGLFVIARFVVYFGPRQPAPA